MLTNITTTSQYVTDQDEALAFYVGKLGLEVAADVDLGFMRWLTLAVPGDPSRSILLERPGAPSMDEETAAQVRELMAKGATGGLFLATDDARRTYADLVAKGVEMTSEPIEQPYGIDFGLRDPFGNHIRIAQLNTGPVEFDAEAIARMKDGA